jgi:hypothetical protein
MAMPSKEENLCHTHTHLPFGAEEPQKAYATILECRAHQILRFHFQPLQSAWRSLMLGSWNLHVEHGSITTGGSCRKQLPVTLPLPLPLLLPLLLLLLLPHATAASPATTATAPPATTATATAADNTSATAAATPTSTAATANDAVLAVAPALLLRLLLS